MSPSAAIVGGGPAGASAALGLLRRGWNVTLFEQRTRETGRVCGAFLDPEAARHLRWLDVYDDAVAAGACPVVASDVTTSFGARSRVATAQRRESGLALPRIVLEDVLLNAVAARGGQVHKGARVTDVSADGPRWIVSSRTAGAELASSETAIPMIMDVVVAADGRFSSQAAAEKTRSGWYGWNATFENVDRPAGHLSLHFYPGGYAGVLTFANGETNVCGLVLRSGSETPSWNDVFQTAIEKEPALRRLLDGARRTSDWRGVGPLPFSTAMRSSRDILLVGDAAAVGDPFMGEGIGRALGAGPMLHAIVADPKLTDAPVNAKAIREAYERLWKTSYSSRLRLGHWTRAILGRPAIFHLASNLLLNHAGVMRFLTPRMHVGYTG